MRKPLANMARLVALAGITLSMAGCIPLLVTGAATTTGVVAAQERSAGNAVDDAGIKLTINNLYLNHDINDLFKNVDIHVSEGRVELTGSVNKPETKVQAVTLAWRATGVREVIDEIQVNDKSGFVDYARDTWISAQVRSRLLIEKNLRSINYNVETVNGVVYLMGIAQDENELRKATYIASTTSYVKQVVSHVILKDDPRRRAYTRQDQQDGQETRQRHGLGGNTPLESSSHGDADAVPGGGQPESYHHGDSDGVQGGGQPESYHTNQPDSQ